MRRSIWSRGNWSGNDGVSPPRRHQPQLLSPTSWLRSSLTTTGKALWGSRCPQWIDGVIHTAANIDDSWIGVNARELFSARVSADVVVLNDADAAGVAEMRVGAGRDTGGVVLIATMGTGIGSALFTDGVLVPNTELGHLEFRGDSIERYAAASARDRDGLAWDAWAGRVNEFCAVVERLLSPDVIIFGGGASKKAHKWIDRLHTRAEVRVAGLANSAGISGAAMAVQGVDER